MNAWQSVKVSELGRVVTGKTPKTAISENYGGDVPFLTPSDDMSVKYVSKTVKTLTEKGLSEVKNTLLPQDAVCVSCIGSDLGKVVITTKNTVTNQQINSIIVDKEHFDVSFVYYAMLILGKELNFISKTSTAVPIVNKSSFSSYEIQCPSLEQQKQIAAVLSLLDDKIENNQKLNDNLQQQAQAIYSSMFIDNPDPAWSHGHLSDLISVKYGKDHKKLADGIYPVYGSGGIMRYVERPLYNKESVLIPRKGTLNNVMYVNQPFWSVDTMFYTEMKLPNVAKFVYHFVKAKDLASMNAGSAVPSMTTDILNAMELVIPSASALEEFESLVAPMYEAMEANDVQSKALSQMRDTLLPKLMSGELDVSAIQL